MASKVLLATLTTVRDGKRVSFDPSKGPVALTADEMKQLDTLSAKTGKAYYRDPINEGGAAAPAQSGTEIDPEDYLGENTAMADKTVPMLKAYLDYEKIAYTSTATKDDLMKLATAPAGGDQSQADKDAGL